MRRLLSLDVFRGLTVAAMIVVNCPGGLDRFAALRHSEWNGLTPTDAIFPAFLFIMGASIALSRPKSLAKVARRTAILFALGLVYNGFPIVSWNRLRIMNVLQRIALCYFFTAFLFLKTSVKAQLAAAAALLAGYWWLMTHVPVPGFGPGVLTPEGNFASYLDRWLLKSHMFSPQFDPEGLLSTIPAVATAVAGLLAGALLGSDRRGTAKVVGLFAGGAFAVAAGLAWAPWFPINKPLWTGSFCLVTAGFASWGLAACYWLVDVAEIRFWTTPFESAGRNAIAVYFLSEGSYELQKRLTVTLPGGGTQQLRFWICDRLFGAWLAPRVASLAYAVSFCLLWLALASILHRRRAALKV